MADPGFPVGGDADLQCTCFSAKLFAKMKELDPVGGWGVRRRCPLDPPMECTQTLARNLILRSDFNFSMKPIFRIRFDFSMKPNFIIRFDFSMKPYFRIRFDFSMKQIFRTRFHFSVKPNFRIRFEFSIKPVLEDTLNSTLH